MTNLFEVFDDHFWDLVPKNAHLEQIYTGAKWCEGPVYFAEGDYLIWSDIRNNRMLRWSMRDGASVYRQPANFTNGNYRDLTGRMVTCSHGERAVLRTEADGTRVTLVNNYQGKRLNSPNDLVVKSDGTIWFTDPPYGLIVPDEGYPAASELGINYVFRFDPVRNELVVVSDVLDKPNGLAFSPDEKILYVADSARSHDINGNHHVLAFDVIDGTRLVNSRVFAVIDPGVPDGFRSDIHGNLFISSADSVQVYNPSGKRLGKILVPEVVANCTFGGPNRNRLFIAATSSIYTITLNTTGVQKP